MNRARQTDVQALVNSLRPVVSPISTGLCLADIAVEFPDPAPSAAWVSFADFDGQHDAPMLIERGQGLARVMVRLDPALNHTGLRPKPVPTIRYRIACTFGQGPRISSGEHVASLAIPPGHQTPDWAKGAVWYQIFVERFRNGNPANDPRPPECFLADWNSDWNAVSVDELELSRANAAALPVPESLGSRRQRGGQLGNVLRSRRYGGDLEGVVEKLDELRDLGVTALYLNPIFHAQSHHKYDASDYRHIDPTFAGPGRSEEEAAAVARETDDPRTWTTTAADAYFFATFIPEVRKRGLRIVLDGVWNHVGLQHWAFQDVVAQGADSPYKDWFQCRFADAERFPDWKIHPLGVAPGRLIRWKSWGDGHNGGLPEFARDKAAGRLFPPVEKHVFDATARWTVKIDGWRLDVVPDMPRPFWRAWSDHVRSINPDAALFSEVWFDSKDYFSPHPEDPVGKIFDGQMNYPFSFAAIRWLSGDVSMPSDKLAAQLDRVFSHAPQHDLVQMNLLASHDTERLASMIANPGRDYDQQGSIASNPGYNSAQPSEEVYRRCVLAAWLQVALPGSPMIYYGDEYGMYGADDPHCRQPLPWDDRGPYLPGVQLGPALRQAIRAGYREALRLRSDRLLGPILRFGSLRSIPSGDPDVLLLERRLNDRSVLFIANRSPTRSVELAPLIAVVASAHIPNNRTRDESTIEPLGAAIRLVPETVPVPDQPPP